MMLKILYRDEDYIVVHKPVNLLVHRSYRAADKIFLLQTLRNQIGQQVYPVHRLDRPTSGVICFALHSEAAREFSDQLQARQVKKTYWAILRGYCDLSGQIDHPVKTETGKQKQAAITDYRLLATASFPIACRKYPTSRYSLVEFSPQTGRYHQLRQHAAHISHHIIGDTMHGKGEHNRIFRENFGLSRLLLIAKQLEFYQYRQQQNILVETELESEFAAFIQRAEWQYLE